LKTYMIRSAFSVASVLSDHRGRRNRRGSRLVGKWGSSRYATIQALGRPFRGSPHSFIVNDKMYPIREHQVLFLS